MVYKILCFIWELTYFIRESECFTRKTACFTRKMAFFTRDWTCFVLLPSFSHQNRFYHEKPDVLQQKRGIFFQNDGSYQKKNSTWKCHNDWWIFQFKERKITQQLKIAIKFINNFHGDKNRLGADCMTIHNMVIITTIGMMKKERGKHISKQE